MVARACSALGGFEKCRSEVGDDGSTVVSDVDEVGPSEELGGEVISGEELDGEVMSGEELDDEVI